MYLRNTNTTSQVHAFTTFTLIIHQLINIKLVKYLSSLRLIYRQTQLKRNQSINWALKLFTRQTLIRLSLIWFTNLERRVLVTYILRLNYISYIIMCSTKVKTRKQSTQEIHHRVEQSTKHNKIRTTTQQLLVSVITLQIFIQKQ